MSCTEERLNNVLCLVIDKCTGGVPVMVTDYQISTFSFEDIEKPFLFAKRNGVTEGLTNKSDLTAFEILRERVIISGEGDLFYKRSDYHCYIYYLFLRKIEKNLSETGSLMVNYLACDIALELISSMSRYGDKEKVMKIQDLKYELEYLLKTPNFIYSVEKPQYDALFAEADALLEKRLILIINNSLPVLKMYSLGILGYKEGLYEVILLGNEDTVIKSSQPCSMCFYCDILGKYVMGFGKSFAIVSKNGDYTFYTRYVKGNIMVSNDLDLKVLDMSVKTFKRNLILNGGI